MITVNIKIIIMSLTTTVMTFCYLLVIPDYLAFHIIFCALVSFGIIMYFYL